MAAKDDYLADLYKGRASAQVQLNRFDEGMRFYINGEDRTDFHVATLKKMIKNYDKLIKASGA